ncbi:hypothetical protein [Cellulomonas alba]|uniref:Uncharacterized protein n=1 Tax=Cellulomonas alba TaxID=3053467 RepID=A0ABT7SKB0_9CELL|nr:hypothetical protein [Cellulomonas alba]MDM7856630.1 hypothetical protein [Cellulomonas alba]
MTDARLPERWLNDRRFMRLSDAAWRLYTLALMWSVANRTDGLLECDDLNLLHRVDPRNAAALVDAGVWEPTAQPRGWRIVGFDETQSTSQVLAAAEHARRIERDRKRQQRARRATSSKNPSPPAVTADVPQDVPPDVPPPVPQDVPPDTTRTRTGQGQALMAGAYTCAVCGQPMLPVGDGATTHPDCSPTLVVSGDPW